MSGETLTRYRFPGTDGAWWLGLRALPLIWLAAVVTVTVLGLYLGASLLVGVATLTVGAAAALVPLGGRSAIEWAPGVVRTAGSRATGTHRWRDVAVLRPAAPRPATSRLPARLGEQRIVDVDGVAVVDDRRHGLAVGLLNVTGTDRFALSEPVEQTRLLDAWGSALTALGADPRITRLQLVERAAPEDRDAAAWMRQRCSGEADDAVADYLQLVDEVTSQSARHDVWLAVGVDRSAGLNTLPGVLRDVAARLLPARLVAQTLSAQEAGDLLRRCLDGPSIRTGAQQLRVLSQVEGWEQVRVDDCMHRAFAVIGWPRLLLSAGWLEPLFLAAPAGVARTVSVHLHPVPAAEAARRARSARSRAQLDASDRARFGLVDSARVEADAAEAVATEEELVAGYRLHRLAAVLTVAAPTVTLLDDGCRAVRTAAETARLELRPLHGQHTDGLIAALPLCRPNGRAR